jgi:hypothetical protein
MNIVFFYENLDVFNKISDKIIGELISYNIKKIDKLKDTIADFLIIEVNHNNLDKIIDEIELTSNTPYIIITNKIPSKNYNSLHLLEIITYNEINDIDKKIKIYFNKAKLDGFSIFEITGVMQMISMERKDIALKVTSDDKIGVLVFKEGRPIYSKSIINKKKEEGILSAFKILSWDNIKFKLVKVIGEIENNLDIDITNLLMKAMQYKDEEELSNKNNHIKLNSEEIIKQFKGLNGYIGGYILKDGKELFNHHLNNSYIKNKDLKKHLDKINNLVGTMLNDIGFKNFESIVLSTETSSAIIQHDYENKLDLILFIEKDSNIPLSKVIIKKVMMGIS